MGSREQLAENALEIKGYLEATEIELKAVEASLATDSSNPFLLRRYDRLSKKEEKLLHERSLFTAAALQNHSWQAGLMTAPGVKDLLTRLASECSSWSEPQLQRIMAGGGEWREQRGASGRARRGALEPSPDKAQLMMLADAADISERGGFSGEALPRAMGGRGSTGAALEGGVTSEGQTHRKRRAPPAQKLPLPKPAAPKRRRTAAQSGQATDRSDHLSDRPATAASSDDEAGAVDVPVVISQDSILDERVSMVLRKKAKAADGTLPHRLAHSSQPQQGKHDAGEDGLVVEAVQGNAAGGGSQEEVAEQSAVLSQQPSQTEDLPGGEPRQGQEDADPEQISRPRRRGRPRLTEKTPASQRPSSAAARHAHLAAAGPNNHTVHGATGGGPDKQAARLAQAVRPPQQACFHQLMTHTMTQEQPQPRELRAYDGYLY